MEDEQHIYIIGSKGIPAKYGGFETFVEKLTEHKKNKSVKYHVACMKENSEKSGYTDKHFAYNDSDCFNIDVPNIGPAKAIYYDVAALNYAVNLAKKNKDKSPIFYVLACRIGPFIKRIRKKIKKLGGKLYVNPDGHEWLREKWSIPVRKYWKLSENLMVKHSDLLICDSKSIEKYIKNDYSQYSPATSYISYGTDLEKAELDIESGEVISWFDKYKVKLNEYYLAVGRFVPENNYETMIKEFMKSNSTKDFVLITNVEENKFFKSLQESTNFKSDPRIKFVGTVYNQHLLKFIRENAFAYIHGHEVGGTNPSLLEAMYSTKLNLLLKIGFNTEVGANTVEYWTKENNSLEQLINKMDLIDPKEVENFDEQSKKRIEKSYSWPFIINEYEKKFKEK